MKRRFRALAREIVPSRGFAGSDHVMIGRGKGIERDFGLLRSELAGALDRLRRAPPPPSAVPLPSQSRGGQ
jgi:ribonuclease P protein component